MAYGMADVIQRGPHDRRGRGCRRHQAGGAGEAQCAPRDLRDAGLPASGDSQAFRRKPFRRLWKLRHLPQARRDLGRARRGDQGAGRDLSHRRTLRHRASDRCSGGQRENDKTIRFGHTDMPVFGAGKDLPSKTWQSVFRQLLAAGYIRVDHTAFGALKLEETRGPCSSAKWTCASARIARPRARRRAVQVPRARRMPRPGSTRQTRRYSRRCAPGAWSLRKNRACPPYVVFPDTTLIALATERPMDEDEMLGISGIGQSKLERYGDAFLEVITAYSSEVSPGLHGQIETIYQPMSVWTKSLPL